MSSLILDNNNESFLDWIVMSNVKWIFYDNQRWPAQWSSELLFIWTWKEVPKRFQSQTCAKKRSSSLFAAHLIYCNFLNLSETLYLRSRLSKSMRCIENHKACSQHWSTGRINSSSWQHPILCHTTNTSKVEPIGLWSFASSSIFTWTLSNQLLLFKPLNNFLQGKHFHNQQNAKNKNVL